jgi:hypothetical protein
LTIWSICVVLSRFVPLFFDFIPMIRRTSRNVNTGHCDSAQHRVNERNRDVSPAESDRKENEGEVWQSLAALLEREDDFCSGVPFFYVSDGTGGVSRRIASVDHWG